MPTVGYVIPAKGPLYEVPVPDRTRAADPRRILECPREVVEVLFGRSAVEGFPQPRFLALVQRFVGHLYVSASLNGDPKRRKPDFERLSDVEEVWVMCFREPKMSQWRLMGRFIQYDRFVGIELYNRAFLDGKQQYQEIASGFPDRWNVFTDGMPPLVRTSVYDYISRPSRDVYESVA